jgi:DNA-directed RNA polymerase subunit RPC12/RpoP
MSDDTNITTEAFVPIAHTSSSDEYRWIKCRGCGGKVGVPLDWKENSVECPECGATVLVNDRVLYRPPDDPVPTPNPAPATVAAPSANKSPSMEIVHKAETTLLWGIASIVFGWTFLVPFNCWGWYHDTAETAKTERVPVPGKATIGLVLALLFGGVQTICMVPHVIAFLRKYRVIDF